MKRKDFLVSATAGLLTLSQVSEAQRPDRPDREGPRNQRRGRPGGNRGGGMAGMITGMMGTSWVGLTFEVNVDDKTLLAARSIYQKTMDESKKLMAEAMETRDWQSMRPKMEAIRNTHKDGLKKILSEEQMTKLEEYEQEQMQQQAQRFGGGRGGGGRRGGGERRGDGEG